MITAPITGLVIGGYTRDKISGKSIATSLKLAFVF
jgi:hypothetical protein